MKPQKKYHSDLTLAFIWLQSGVLVEPDTFSITAWIITLNFQEVQWALRETSWISFTVSKPILQSKTDFEK